MPLTSGQKTLAFFASFAGILQGVAAVFASLICIILYIEGIVTYEPSNYFETYSLLLYEVFLDKNYETIINEILITPAIFNIFMWFYLLFGTVWIISSILLSIAVQYNEKTRVSRASKLWMYITCLVSILDLILTCFIGNDFETCLINSTLFNNPANQSKAINEMLCYNIWLPVMAFAARGYVLWFVNLVFAYFLYMNQRSSFEDVNNPSEDQIQRIPRPVINVQPPVNPNFMPNDYWNGQNVSRSPLQSPNQFNRWPNQWEMNLNENDDRTMVENPVYPTQIGPNQARYVY